MKTKVMIGSPGELPDDIDKCCGILVAALRVAQDAWGANATTSALLTMACDFIAHTDAKYDNRDIIDGFLKAYEAAAVLKKKTKDLQ